MKKLTLILFSCSLAACGGRENTAAEIPMAFSTEQDIQVQCLLEDPRHAVGKDLDAPGRLKVDTPAASPVIGACAAQSQYQLGTGLHDITAPIADTASLAWVNPQQVFSGLHSRVYARAFAMASPCNGKRIAFVSIDTGLMSASVRQAVLAEIAADEVLAQHYNAHNLMLSVTHTHSDPGTGLAGVGNGAAVIVGGIVEAIRKAHLNLEAHPANAGIQLSSGELLNTNINRSKPAFAMNTETERREFLNERGEEVQVDKQMVQLEMQRADGTPSGLINWFGVHPTVIGPAQIYVSGDVKGTASLEFERLMGTDYRADPAQGTFVSAFAQAVEGDASPNIFIEERPYPDPQRGGGSDEFDSNAISALKQLARALELYGNGETVAGPIDYRLIRIPIENIAVDDPAVLNSLIHPAELDSDDKRTCSGILGVSFGAGAEDGPGPTTEGLKCSDDPAVLDSALADIATLTGTRLEGFPGGWPAQTIPGQTLSAAAMCNIDLLPPILGDFSCQAEKPLLLPRGESELPLQLFRVGQLALLGLPWEVTTMSARRIKELMLVELAPIGITDIVIAGLVNDYVHYLTTREEYASQQYEGASNIYGPWTLAVVSQESLKLARAMRSDSAIDVSLPTAERMDLSLQAGPNETLHPAGIPGSVITQPAEQVQAGDLVQAEFVVGHPGNDLRLQESYIYVERQGLDGEWQLITEDRDPQLIYLWKPLIKVPIALERPPVATGGSGEVSWQTPRNLKAGVYRFRIAGKTRGLLSADATPYEALSDNFNVTANENELCPGSLSPPS
ncbi:MAG: neutral/alkaline non-lysosomal ceramidase N-terminal domain-containing protein [Oceanococcus sp.]